jgi:hypothetical protein
MKAGTFWRTVVADESDFLDRVLNLLDEHSIRYCAIGGQAVNAYADPLVSLDLDIVVAADQVEPLEAILSSAFKVERFPHSINVSEQDSDLRLQVQTDERYFSFVERAQLRDVLGTMIPVADIADVLQGKIWAASDPTRRASRRLKDLTDITRILELRPDLADAVPQDLRTRLL